MPKRYLDRRAEAEIEAMLAREEEAARRATSAREAKTPAKQAVGARRAAGDWQGLVEQRILDGMERGLFDNLRGEGQPLNLDEDRFVPDELKMAFRLLRSSGLAPMWVDLNREIRDDIARLQRFRAHIHEHLASISAIELAHRRDEYARRIAEINGKILNYNIIAPASQVHIGLLRPDEELERFDHPDADADQSR